MNYGVCELIATIYINYNVIHIHLDVVVVRTNRWQMTVNRNGPRIYPCETPEDRGHMIDDSVLRHTEEDLTGLILSV